jgi:hypothetical protein
VRARRPQPSRPPRLSPETVVRACTALRRSARLRSTPTTGRPRGRGAQTGPCQVACNQLTYLHTERGAEQRPPLPPNPYACLQHAAAHWRSWCKISGLTSRAGRGRRPTIMSGDAAERDVRHASGSTG